MAGGKLSPRQKMINMMYLVLTALLALNVSKDILQALAKLDDGYKETITLVEKQNSSTYGAFDKAALDNPQKAGSWRDKAYEVKSKADEVFGYIAKVRSDLEEKSGLDDDGNLKKPDNLEISANYILNPVNVGGQDAGKIMKQKLQEYKDFLLQKAEGNEELRSTINSTFDMSDVVDKKNKTKMPWEKATFEHFPLIAVMAFLSDIQADVRRMESQAIEYLRQNIDAGDFKFTGVRTVVMPTSNFITQGEEYHAEVFLAAYDETQDPEVEIEGIGANVDIKDGKGIITFKPTKTGEQKWAGLIKIKQNGEVKEFNIPETTFNVAPPSVVISPSKLNVLYRGVDNPLEISVPGVDPARLVVSGPGVRPSGGGYVANVDKISGKEITINVAVKEEDGKTRQAGSKVFRIKGLPQATGMVYGQSTSVRSKSATMAATIEAKFEDFPFDLDLTVTAFEVKIEGAPPVQVRGNKFDANTKKRIETLKPGSTVIVRNIQAVGPNNYRVTKVGSISIDIN